MNLAKFHKDAAKHRPLKFLEAMRRNSAALSTEPRDKDFALLGLVYDSALYIPVPNYRQSLKDVCVSTTLSAISTTSSVDTIPLLAPHSDRSFLPSWCPNWSGLDGSSLSRPTEYWCGKRSLFPIPSPMRRPTQHLTTAGMGGKIHYS
jgi:hypothetical protein